MKLPTSRGLRSALVSSFGLCVACLPAAAQFPPAPGTGTGLAETLEAIESARVTTRILYVTAHPDDESAAVLTYLARGLHADVALLSLTRGEGGQNALGPEQAPQLGLIRTQELLAATRSYGAKLFFTHAPDFGYSKTPEETMKVWGNQVLDDMVRVMRTFRPHIVINNWGDVHAGHGHHQAAGLLTPKAVQMAADEKAFPTQLREGLAVWGGGKRAVLILGLERGTEKPSGYILPLDDVSPLWGKTWRELGLDAFVNHRTQGIAGFLGSQFLRRPVALRRADGGAFDPAALAKPLRTLGEELEGLGYKLDPDLRAALPTAERDIEQARSAALALEWKRAAQNLAHAVERIDAGRLPAHNPVREELERVSVRLEKALTLTAGFDLDAKADRSELVAGETFHVTTSSRCRQEVKCVIGDPALHTPDLKPVQRQSGTAQQAQFEVTVGQPVSPPSEWDQLLPVPPPLFEVSQPVTIEDFQINEESPVTHIQASSTRVDKVPLRIVPAYTLAVEPGQAIEVLSRRRKPFDVFLRVHSYATQAAKVTAGVDAPAGWKTGAPLTAEFAGAGDRYVRLSVNPPEKLAAGTYKLSVYARRGADRSSASPDGEKFTTSVEPLPSLPTELWSEPAQCVVHAFDISVPENLRVGYITAEGEPIPEALERLGIHVEKLDDAALAFGNLSKYDAIVVGVRAYELRSGLPSTNQRLLEYVSKGGTLLVQYNRNFVWDELKPAPYPATIGNSAPRITDENSPVKFLRPGDALLSRPNKITQADFKGWVQERGLYFWSQFDRRYTPLLAMRDPGETDLNGGLVYTRFGKGTYIYAGLAFFRQLPEGVPGAYRLFVNLLSASRPPKRRR